MYKAEEEAAMDMEKKLEIIRQIRALESNPSSRVKVYLLFLNIYTYILHVLKFVFNVSIHL